MKKRSTETKNEMIRQSVTVDPNTAAMAELHLKIEGDTLIQQLFSEKAKLAMRKTHMKQKKGPKDAKVPVRMALDCAYWVEKKPGTLPEEIFKAEDLEFPIRYENTEGWRCGFPAAAVKEATKRGLKLISEVHMIDANQMFWVEVSEHPDPAVNANGLFVIDFESFDVREDSPPIASGNPDLRYRCQFNNWKADLIVTFDSRLVRPEDLTEWIRYAGHAVGIGEWRPCSKKGKAGTHGKFRVVESVAYLPKAMEEYVKEHGMIPLPTKKKKADDVKKMPTKTKETLTNGERIEAKSGRKASQEKGYKVKASRKTKEVSS